MLVRVAILTLPMVSVSAVALAQPPAGDAAQDAQGVNQTQTWSGRFTTFGFFFPSIEDYVDPIVAIDRGALHVEGRYSYEARGSASTFVGLNFEFGDAVALHLTPMFGILMGDSTGVIPALELDLAWKRIEVYLETEVVIGPGRRNHFLYDWSEVAVRAAEWLKVGTVIERTRIIQGPRDIQRGLLVGVVISRVEPVFYFFNPGSDDHFFVASVRITF